MHFQISGDREVVPILESLVAKLVEKKLHVVGGTFKCLHTDYEIQE